MVFLEVMNKGDATGRVFTFPIPTYNITKDLNLDSPIVDKLFEVTAKYGIPYFQNYIGSGLDHGSVRAMCCGLTLYQNELLNRPGNMWGTGEKIGRAQV